MTINNKINFVYNAFSRHIDRTYELVEAATPRAPTYPLECKRDFTLKSINFLAVAAVSAPNSLNFAVYDNFGFKNKLQLSARSHKPFIYYLIDKDNFANYMFKNPCPIFARLAKFKYFVLTSGQFILYFKPTYVLV